MNLNVTSTSTNYALLVESGGNVFLSGIGNFNITSTGLCGTYINGSVDKATRTNATGNNIGVYARQGAELTVLRNVTETRLFGIY